MRDAHSAVDREQRLARGGAVGNLQSIPFGQTDLDAVSNEERRGRALLDHTHHRLLSGDLDEMDDFVVGLRAVRDALPTARWRSFVAEAVAAHPVRAVLHEEPFTRHAFEKPRGYPGDAGLLDLIYRDRPFSGPITARGVQLHNWSEKQPACRSVRARRDLLAGWIDITARNRAKPRILSVACGHLREAQRSEAVRGGHIGELVAVDQDPASVSVVEREQKQFNVTPIVASFRRLMLRSASWGTFDFAYAAGLYDYLPALAAQRLTRTMFTMLRPGGVLLVANFAPELRDIGYMEAIMDWTLIYRDESTVERFAELLPPEEIATRDIFRDAPGNVVYLVIRKA